jgi:hypothetical protein
MLKGALHFGALLQVFKERAQAGKATIRIIAHRDNPCQPSPTLLLMIEGKQGFIEDSEKQCQSEQRCQKNYRGTPHGKGFREGKGFCA